MTTRPGAFARWPPFCATTISTPFACGSARRSTNWLGANRRRSRRARRCKLRGAPHRRRASPLQPPPQTRRPTSSASRRRSSACSTPRPRRVRSRSSSVGDRVVPGQVLCILEAMKLMNEITSELRRRRHARASRKRPAGLARRRPVLDRTVVHPAHKRRGFAELLADRRGLLDAPHYPQTSRRRSPARWWRRFAAGRKCCGAATAAARPTRSTLPPNSADAFCASARACRPKRSRSTPAR